MMNTSIRLNNDEKLRSVVGGWGDDYYFKVKFESLKFHFGKEITAYEAEKYIGQKVIVKKEGLFNDYYYVGILAGSWEESYYVKWSRRTIKLIDEENKNYFMEVANVDFICTYVN